MKQIYVLLLVFWFLLVGGCAKQTVAPNFKDLQSRTWDQITAEAHGQDLYFNVWGGSSTINDYIMWVGSRLAEKYAIKLIFVPLDSTSSAVTRILQERSFDSPSSIDVVWVNGQNFRSLNEENALFGDILSLIPNKKIISDNPLLYEDFTITTMGKEVPWGTAQLTFFHSYGKDEQGAKFDFATLINDMLALPYTFTYPSPLDFHGLSFLKTLLYVLSPNKDILYSPFEDDENTNKSLLYSHPLWDYLDALHPFLYQKGKTFPISHAEMLEWYQDGLIRYAFSFNPYEPVNKIIDGSFSQNTVSFVPKEGTLANAHFLTIPKGSTATQAALVLINFLLSPEAQARKANPKFWGDPTVLDIALIDEEMRAKFDLSSVLSQYPDALPPPEIGINTIREFHGSWELPLIDEWQRRYTN